VVDVSQVPDASVYRLSLYHCYLGDVIRQGGGKGRVTSRELASELDLKEETVRRDLAYIGGVGRPGSGYEITALFSALQTFLGLKDRYPVVKVGSADMLAALRVVFPAHRYGLEPVAYFSVLPEDAGRIVNDIEVRPIAEIPHIDPALGVSVALVACSPEWVQRVLELLSAAGISGVLLLTPSIKLDIPEGMNLTHVRMPCDIKSLACRCQMMAER